MWSESDDDLLLKVIFVSFFFKQHILIWEKCKLNTFQWSFLVLYFFENNFVIFFFTYQYILE